MDSIALIYVLAKDSRMDVLARRLNARKLCSAKDETKVETKATCTLLKERARRRNLAVAGFSCCGYRGRRARLRVTQDLSCFSYPAARNNPFFAD